MCKGCLEPVECRSQRAKPSWKALVEFAERRTACLVRVRLGHVVVHAVMRCGCFWASRAVSGLCNGCGCGVHSVGCGMSAGLPLCAQDVCFCMDGGDMLSVHSRLQQTRVSDYARLVIETLLLKAGL